MTYAREDDEWPEDPADVEADRRVLSWGPAANPNTAEGQVQGVAAFAAATTAATGWRRTAGKAAAWLALLFIVGYVAAALIMAVH
ncbi:MAG: hypothetical protein JO147_05005 [Actinobacteria bacterium]|nr:hypothetical protein [Actinomycetota bacterium]